MGKEREGQIVEICSSSSIECISRCVEELLKCLPTVLLGLASTVHSSFASVPRFRHISNTNKREKERERICIMFICKRITNPVIII